MPNEDVAVLLERLFAPANRADPYPVYELLRPLTPVALDNRPVVVLTSFDDCQAVLRSPEYSVDLTGAQGRPPRSARVLDHIPNPPSSMGKPAFHKLDAPAHTRIRNLVSRAFTPRAVAKLNDEIRRVIDGLIDGIERQAAGGAAVDVVADFALPLPVAIICRMLGVPAEDEPRFAQWGEALTRAIDPVVMLTGAVPPDIAAGMTALAGLHRYVDELVATRRHTLGDDLLSTLITAEEAGDKLDHDELVNTVTLLLSAGYETTVNLVANALLALTRHPEEWANLRAAPDRAGPVIEEVLRYDPPLQLALRMTTKPQRIGEVDVANGTVLLLLLGAANRDPAAFTEPGLFTPDRSQPGHLAFGNGAHFCLGASLARVEGRLAVARFVQRIGCPDFAEATLDYRPAVMVRGLRRLPLQLGAVAPNSLPWPEMAMGQSK